MAENAVIQIKRKLDDPSMLDKVLRSIATDLWAAVNQRVFFKGLLSSGSAPAAYSSKPLWASLKISSKLKGDGKFSAKRKFKNGKLRKSEYLPGGYKMLKDRIGRPNRFDFTGQLKKAFTFSQEKKNVYLLGFAGTARKTATKLPTTTKHGEIVEGLEEKYGNIFTLTKQEEEKIDNIISTQIDLLFNK